MCFTHRYRNGFVLLAALVFVAVRVVVSDENIAASDPCNLAQALSFESPHFLNCGGVGDASLPTEIVSSFSPAEYYQDCGSSWINWGDGSDSDGYPAIVVEDNESTMVFLHLYSEPGIY